VILVALESPLIVGANPSFLTGNITFGKVEAFVVKILAKKGKVKDGV